MLREHRGNLRVRFDEHERGVKVGAVFLDMFARARPLRDDRSVDVEMTLTTPNCPAAAEMPTMVENAVASVPGVGQVNVNIVWDPAWTPDRMTDEARLVLNMW